MERAYKDKIYGLLIIFCLFLISIGLPFERWMALDWANLSKAAVKLLFFGVSVLLIKKYELASNYFRLEGKRFLLCLPFFLICGSNMLFLAINGNATVEASHLWSSLILCLATALSEELFFRVVIIEVTKERIKEEWALILISAGSFSLIHAVNFLNGNPGAVLAQMGYTFVLGLLLGMLYLRGGKLLLAFLLHFFFNAINTSLFECLYAGDWNLTFYLVNIGVGLAVIAYWLILLLKEKSHPRLD